MRLRPQNRASRPGYPDLETWMAGRRAFLQGLGTLTGAAIVAGISGCSESPPPERLSGEAPTPEHLAGDVVQPELPERLSGTQSCPEQETTED